MTNTRTRVESRWSLSGVIGRGLLSALVLSGTLGALAQRAEAQTVVVDRSRPVDRTERVTEMTVTETESIGQGSGPALITTGAIMLTAGWVSSFAVGLHEGPELFVQDEQLNRPRIWYEDFLFDSFIPIAGPWIALSQHPGGFDDDAWGIWLVANGLLQAAGFTMIIGGIIASCGRDVRVRRRQTVRVSDAGPSLQVVPNVGATQASLSLSGSF
jgi:hypothetical protein